MRAAWILPVVGAPASPPGPSIARLIVDCLRPPFQLLLRPPPNDRPRTPGITMWFQATLLLLASCIPSSLGVYRDEVNHIDYHHALLGLPASQSTFFLKPSASSNASLLYTLSEKALLGAVNPKDGSLVWRQNLSRSALPASHDSANGLLRASEGTNALVSALGGYVSSWSALDGKLIWENWFDGESVADLELLELEDASAAPSTKDTVALFGGKAGVVRRLDGDSGKTKWEYLDERCEPAFPCF